MIEIRYLLVNVSTLINIGFKLLVVDKWAAGQISKGDML